MAKVNMRLVVLTCLRCGHQWIPRKDKYSHGNYPQACPKCQSWYWDAPFGAVDLEDSKQMINKAHGGQ